MDGRSLFIMRKNLEALSKGGNNGASMHPKSTEF